MLTATSSLAIGYDTHPHFRFAAAELPVDNSAAEELNRLCDTARNFPSLVRKNQQRTIRERCRHLLDRIFDTMSGEPADHYEKLFLDGLRLECQRLLSDELRFYATRSERLGIDLIKEASGARANALREHKFFFDNLPETSVRSILELGQTGISNFRENIGKGVLTREALSLGTGKEIGQIAAILNGAYERLGVLDAVSAYSGRSMHVTGVGLELSVAKSAWWESTFADLPRPPATLYAHLDEAISQPKAIVYLTDVGDENGPTSCYPGLLDEISLTPLQLLVGRIIGNVGAPPDSPLRAYYKKTYHQSVGSENFRRHFMRLPRALRFNSHFGWDLYPDSALEKRMVEKEIFMKGKAGTMIVFDGGNLVHRGGLVKGGERLALQVVFGEPSWKRKVIAKVRKTLK